jgi:acetyl-CoA carboxylase biotin carboxyl carrier protein
MSSDDDQLKSLAREAHALLGKVGGPVRKISVKSGDHHIVIEWDPTAAPAGPAGAMPTGGGMIAADTGAADGDGLGGGHIITAPLVGTFYRAPEPGAAPFVEEGDPIDVGQEIGIVEAMKIMNRIVSDAAGRLGRVLVADGEMVEFGQALFQLEAPDDEG